MKRKVLVRIITITASVIAGAAIMLSVFVLGGGGFFEDLLNMPLGSARRPASAGSDAEPEELLRQAYAALDYIVDGDFKGLSRFAHPEQGVLFAPYGTISLSANRRFTPAQLALFGSDSTVYVWGVYDATGDPIEMTPSDYIARFVLDRDFAAAPVVGVDYIVRSGNALENIAEIMPDVRFVDLHIPATEENGMDWSSLRLGFEEYRGELRLTFVGHSEWTV